VAKITVNADRAGTKLVRVTPKGTKSIANATMDTKAMLKTTLKAARVNQSIVASDSASVRVGHNAFTKANPGVHRTKMAPKKYLAKTNGEASLIVKTAVRLVRVIIIVSQ
jgi:hypothetical protein